jgi:virginiamycin B lyase
MRTVLLLAAFAALTAPLTSAVADAAADDLGAPLAGSTFAGALAAGPDGNVWLSATGFDSEVARVVGKVTPAGKVAEYAAPTGADSIAAGADGNLWFTESKGIGRITPGGDITSFDLAKEAGTPGALTAGPDGDVWFVASEPAAIGRVSPTGAITTFPLAGTGQPSAIAAGPDRDLWFTEPEAGRIGRITSAGAASEFPLPKGSQPNSIVLGPDGNLWFSDASQARVGRITPAGEATFFPVPTIAGTDEVVVGPDGSIWFTAENEIGTISTGGKVAWPSCFSLGCQFPPAAMTMGPDGRLWVASGIGHCPGYCGGGSEQAYLTLSGSIGRFAPASITVGIGPRLARLRHGRTSIVIGCGDRGACDGTLRLRALVKRPGNRYLAPLISKVTYSLARGEIKEFSLRLSLTQWNRLRYGRGFLIVDAIQDGSRVAKRGFYFSPKEGGIAKHW